MIQIFKKYKNNLEKFNWFPALTTRIAVGWVFVESGWGKLHNIEKVTGYFTSLGIPLPAVQAPMVAGIEFLGGIMLILGLATRIVSIPLIGIMSVAILTAKWSEIASTSDLFGFSEFLYIVLLLWLLINGPSNLALDHLVAKKMMKS
jgi:putative oxidoreductase